MSGRRPHTKKYSHPGQAIPASLEQGGETAGGGERVVVREIVTRGSGWAGTEWAVMSVIFILLAITLVTVIAIGVTSRNQIDKIKSDVNDIEDLPSDIVTALQPVLNQQTEDINDHTTEVGQEILTNVTKQLNVTNINIIRINDTVNTIDKNVDSIQEEQQKQKQQLNNIEKQLDTIQDEIEDLGVEPVPVSRIQCALSDRIIFSNRNGEQLLASSGLLFAWNEIENGVLYSSDTGEFKFDDLGGENDNDTVMVSLQARVLISDIKRTVDYRLTASVGPDCTSSNCGGGYISKNGRYESDDDEGGCASTSTFHEFGCQLLWLELEENIKARVGDTLYFFLSANKQDNDDDDGGLGEVATDDDDDASSCARARFSFQTIAPPFLPGDGI